MESSRDDTSQTNPPEPSSNGKVSKRKKALARDRLSNSVLLELWSIWRANPRVPSIKSRRAWAVSRNATPRLVDNWFLRRRTATKKAGETIPNGHYELSLEPCITQEPSKLKQEPCSPVPFDLPSDDTLAYPENGELDRLETSSDTVWDECSFTETKVIKTSAYTKVLPKEDRDLLQRSSDEVHTLEDLPDRDIVSLVSDDPVLPVCNQGRGQQSNKFTCILCSKKPLRGTLKNFKKILQPAGAAHIATPEFLRLDVSPDTLMELSAIPFLFRTPTTVAPQNRITHQGMDSWTTVEEELSELVREGKLDFSFLDVPDLTSMQLLD